MLPQRGRMQRKDWTGFHASMLGQAMGELVVRTRMTCLAPQQKSRTESPIASRYISWIQFGVVYWLLFCYSDETS